MRRISLALLLALCALASPQAPAFAQGFGGAGPASAQGFGGAGQPAAQSRVTGAITLALDARETPRKLLHARETLTVTPGALTLVYPKWLPGEHAPDGAIDDLVGLTFSAGGKTIPWRRDPVDLFAFHLDIPQGAGTLDASFDFLSAIGAGGFSSASSETAHLGIYSWNQVLLYPQGARTDDVMFRPSLQIPAGWKFATALEAASENGGRIDFAPVSLTTLVDSPVIAGEYLKVFPLDDTSSSRVEADLVGDTAASIEIPADLTQKWKRLVQEADAMFGARHYDRYHFLLTLSDRVAHFGLEHHQSNDSRVNENSLTQQNSIGVVAHEYVHSWNGKFRRPAGLATPDFQQPMVGDLLWVYEGLTQYLGYVLAERSGIWSESYYKERLAQIAAYLDTEPGRDWRPLADTTTAAQLLYFSPGQWTAYRRSTDFYDEGWLIWLDVDTAIRELTRGAKSIEDFCHLFHGGESGPPMVKPYTLDDVVAALNQVAPHDWKAFLGSRIYQVAPRAPLDGITRSGWRLAYTDAKNEFIKTGDGDRVEAMSSLGLRVRARDGMVNDVILNSPAGKAGIGPGMQILAVNGLRFSAEVLRNAIRDSKTASGPLTIEFQNDDLVKTVPLDYHGGMREPHLERVADKPDLLGQILAARARR
jgi:predicted metalloprotease with PDZ domain